MLPVLVSWLLALRVTLLPWIAAPLAMLLAVFGAGGLEPFDRGQGLGDDGAQVVVQDVVRIVLAGHGRAVAPVVAVLARRAERAAVGFQLRDLCGAEDLAGIDVGRVVLRIGIVVAIHRQRRQGEGVEGLFGGRELMGFGFEHASLVGELLRGERYVAARLDIAGTIGDAVAAGAVGIGGDGEVTEAVEGGVAVEEVAGDVELQLVGGGDQGRLVGVVVGGGAEVGAVGEVCCMDRDGVADHGAGVGDGCAVQGDGVAFEATGVGLRGGVDGGRRAVDRRTGLVVDAGGVEREGVDALQVALVGERAAEVEGEIVVGEQGVAGLVGVVAREGEAQVVAGAQAAAAVEGGEQRGDVVVRGDVARVVVDGAQRQRDVGACAEGTVGVVERGGAVVPRNVAGAVERA